jgi:hypothetical protein
VRGFPGFEEKDNVSNFPLGREVGETEDSVEKVGEEYDIGRCEVGERRVQLVGDP